MPETRRTAMKAKDAVFRASVDRLEVFCYH